MLSVQKFLKSLAGNRGQVSSRVKVSDRKLIKSMEKTCLLDIFWEKIGFYQNEKILRLFYKVFKTILCKYIYDSNILQNV